MDPKSVILPWPCRKSDKGTCIENAQTLVKVFSIGKDLGNPFF